MSIKYGTNGDLQERYVCMDKRLPAEYQEVEWIASSGNCRIDTGVQTNGTYFKIDTKINFLSFSGSTTYPYIFGPVDGGQCFICYDGSGHIQYGAGNNDIIKDSISANTDYSIIAEWNSGILTTGLNGSSATDTYSGGLSTHDIPIFCRRRSNNVGYNCYSTNLKIYYFKMYSSSNTLARDLVPCYRKSDDVIGMYDLVNKVFYTNQGTGTFTKGNDQDTPGLRNVTEVYIGNGDSTATKIRPVGWQPDPSRTIFYYDFENNLNDSSGNNNNITSSNYISYEQVGGQYVSYINNGSGYLQITPTLGASIGNGDFTISFWIYPKQPASNKYPMIFGMFNNASPFAGPTIFFDPYNKIGHGDAISFRMRGGTGSYEHPATITASSLYDGWHHIVMTRNSGTVSCYIDNVLEASWNNDTEVFPTISNSAGYILFSNNGISQQRGVTGVKGDKVILENVGWSVQEISDYFYQTKGNYGL